METEQKQMQFEFCGSCGGYLNPADAEAIVRDGKPVVLCRDCKGSPKDTGDLAADFAKKYRL